MPGPMPYERFEAWKVSHELALAVYKATRGWPRSELYGLTSQLRRAARRHQPTSRRDVRNAGQLKSGASSITR